MLFLDILLFTTSIGRRKICSRACEAGEFDRSLVELFQMVGVAGDVEAHGDGGNSDVEFVTGLLDVKRDCHGGGVR